MDATTTAKTAATTYFDAWKHGDFERLRSILADDVTFTGPMGTASGADDYVQSLAGFAAGLDDIAVEKMVADGDDVLTWFNLVPKGDGEPVPVVNWCHLERGRVQRVRVTFDPRPLLASPAPSPRSGA
jgi:ketosteroid isomerase-like protein